MEQYLLGMDCGTTNLKAVLLREDGAVTASASRPSTTIHRGPGMVEQDAEEWWKNAAAIFREIAEKAGAAAVSQIKGIAVSSHTVTMLPLDKNLNPLYYALTCQDGRSAQEVREITGKIGMERFVSIAGGQPAAAFLPNKILWFKRHEPELFKRTKYYIQASSYLNMKLTGKLTTDLDQATRTQCLDIRTMKWSKEIGDVIGVNLEEVMPRLALVDEIIGEVTKEAAEETGLAAGTPVLAGCSDAMASMYAMGLSRLGEAGESSGTTSLVFVGSTKRSPADVPVVTRPCTIKGMPWIFDAPIQSTGASIKWFIEKMGAEERIEAENRGINIYDYLNKAALESKAGAGGVFFFPYLLGERAPLWNEYARGMFVGMSMFMKRSDLVRSVFEGTSYALRHVIETVRKSGGKAEVLRICGGGAKSLTWCQIKASMLRMPVYLLDGSSGDVPVGTALIAGHKTGVFPDLSEAAGKIIHVKEVIEPNEEWARVYDELYPYYLEIYSRLDETLKNLRKTTVKIETNL